MVADSVTAAAMRRLEARICSSKRRRSSRCSSANPCRARSTGLAGSTAASSRAALLALISLEIPPGTSSANSACRRHTVRFRARPQISVALRVQTQHPIVVTADTRQAWRTQRRDRHRQRVVRVVLVRPTRAQHPHPCRQRRRHIQHPLTRGDELTGEDTRAHPPTRPPTSGPRTGPPTPTTR